MAVELGGGELIDHAHQARLTPALLLGRYQDVNETLQRPQERHDIPDQKNHRTLFGVAIWKRDCDHHLPLGGALPATGSSARSVTIV